MQNLQTPSCLRLPIIRTTVIKTTVRHLDTKWKVLQPENSCTSSSTSCLCVVRRTYEVFMSQKKLVQTIFWIWNVFLKTKKSKRDLRSFPRDSSTLFVGVRRLPFDCTEKSQHGECRLFYHVIIKSMTHKNNAVFILHKSWDFPEVLCHVTFQKSLGLVFFVQNLPHTLDKTREVNFWHTKTMTSVFMDLWEELIQDSPIITHEGLTTSPIPIGDGPSRVELGTTWEWNGD